MQMNFNLRVEELKNSCKKLADNERSQLEAKINKEINDEIVIEAEEYENKQKAAYEKKCEQLERSYYKEVYSYEAEEKKRILNTIKQENKKMVEEITNKVINLLETPFYEEYFIDMLKKVLPKIDYSKSKIGLVKRDYEKYSNILKQEYGINCIQIESKYIGGIMVENENILIDSTLKNAIEEEIRKKDLG